jgi:hypothetical protein
MKKETEIMDTTAKVDIRKLQLLNDRIAQTIDALQQVRLSVHGLGLAHTNAAVPGVGFGAVPFGQYPSIPSVAHQAMSPWAASPWAAGLSHSTPYSWAAAQPFAQTVNPVLQQLLWQQGIAGGLSHSTDAFGSPYAWGVDPVSATRIMQSFPFAQMPISPIPAGY